MIKLTYDALRAIFPRAPENIIPAFMKQEYLLTRSGINVSRTRLAYFLANLAHETAGFTIRNLTESINYTHQRAAEVWPNRFPSAAAVAEKYGTDPGWQKRLFDDVYGNRMGNRPGTDDGSRYIGRGGPQVTGREGYREVGKRAGLPLEDQPELATKAEHQPAIACAFWDWKNMNELADADDFRGCVRRWNGGLIGLVDREQRLKQCTAVLAALPDVAAPKPPPVKEPAMVGAGGGLVAMIASWFGAPPQVLIVILIIAVIAAGVVYAIRKRN